MGRIRTALIILPLLAFILLPVLEPFLHNHEIDGEEHGSCPMYAWLQEYNATVIIFEFFLSLYLISLLTPSLDEARSFNITEPRNIRAPPARASL